MKTFYINLLKQFVERNSIENTATPWQRNFQGTREETTLKTGINILGFQGVKPPRCSIWGINKVVAGAKADIVKEQVDIGFDVEDCWSFEFWD